VAERVAGTLVVDVQVRARTLPIEGEASDNMADGTVVRSEATDLLKVPDMLLSYPIFNFSHACRG
jgi:hypothetical protein